MHVMILSLPRYAASVLVASCALSATGCFDPCDTSDAWVGDFFVKSPDDIDGLNDAVCITGSLLIGEIRHDPERTGAGLDDFELSGTLVDVDGLESIHTIEGDLHIAGNLRLTNLDGLRNVEYVGRELRFERYPRGDLILHQNGLLTNLDGLESLYLVGANLLVSAHPFLNSVDGMSSLQRVGWELKFLDNPNLPTEDAQSFGRRVDTAGGLVISGNGGSGGGAE